MDYNFHWRPVFKTLPDLLQSAVLTLEVAILSMILGILFGLALSLIRINMTGPLKWFAVSWIELARNTPALLTIIFLWIWSRCIWNSFQSIPYCIDGLNI